MCNDGVAARGSACPGSRPLYRPGTAVYHRRPAFPEDGSGRIR